MKNISFIIVVMAIVTLFGLVIALNGYSGTLWQNNPAPDGLPAESDNSSASLPNPLLSLKLPEKPATTALGAFSAAVWQDEVRQWAGGKQSVYVVGLSSDTTTCGVTPAWKIQVYGDGEIATFYVENGAIVDTLAAPAAGALPPAVDLGRVIDSDQAWDLASREVQADQSATPAISMGLKTVGTDTFWDLCITGSDRIQIVRVDATSGKVVKVVPVG